MIDRFVIITGNDNALEQRKLCDALGDAGLGWWHWMQHAWLVVAPQELWDASKLRSLALDCVDPSRVWVLVLKVKPEDWAIWSVEKAHSWLQQNWSSEEAPAVHEAEERKRQFAQQLRRMTTGKSGQSN